MVRSALTAQEKAEIWRSYQAGNSLRSISRALGRSMEALRRLVASTGGRPPVVPRRCRLRLSLAEREEISRGVVAADSCRSIAGRLRRAPSTVSREISRNGGRQRYRAYGAEQAAWRRAHGLGDERPVIVFLGRIVPEKGLAVFAETIRLLEQRCGSMQVLVIGDGPSRAWFSERLPGAVFTGFLKGEALATALASGDIFFNPSATETIGNVNLEAMASGLAMVCADVPNTRALLRNGISAACVWGMYAPLLRAHQRLRATLLGKRPDPRRNAI